MNTTEIIVDAIENIMPFVVATDWRMLWVTLGAGFLSAAATFSAVIYTHKKTSRQYEETLKINEQRHKSELERYEKDKLRQAQERTLTIIKTSLKNAAFWQIREKLILDGNDDRVILVSSNEGFEFYDNPEKQLSYDIFTIRNVGVHNIDFIDISVNSKVESSSNEIIHNDFDNFVRLLRPNEEIMLRIHSTSQHNKLLSCVNNGEQFETEFRCVINYLTLAKQQVSYEYLIKVTDTPKKKQGSEIVEYVRKTEIKQDGYKLLDEITIDTNKTFSHFRDLQENLRADRFGYKYRRIGEEQMNGTLDALYTFWKKQGMDDFVKKTSEVAKSIDESMQNVAKSTEGQKVVLEYLKSKIENNNDTPLMLGDSMEESVNEAIDAREDNNE